MANHGISDAEDFGYIPKRLNLIRKELLKDTEDKVFTVRNLCEILDITKATYSRFENNKTSPSFRVVFRAIYLFSTFGYNPMWITTRDNLLIPKKLGSSDFVLNKSTVDSAFNELVKNVKMASESTEIALEKFRERITS